MSKKKQRIAFYGVTVGLSLGLLYWCTPNAHLHLLRTINHVCQRGAYRIGVWGIWAEQKYAHIIDRDRM